LFRLCFATQSSLKSALKHHNKGCCCCRWR